jgi:hypothetical protein
MKKQLLTIVFALLCAGVFAQGKSPKLSIGPEVGLPLGDYRYLYSFSLGGTAKLEIPINGSNFSISATAGYINYFGKNAQDYYFVGNRIYNYTYKVKDAGFIPVKVGGKYYANKNVYLEGEVGIVSNVNSSSDNIAFAFAPGIGISLPIHKSKNAFDLGFRYEGWSNNGAVINQLALRLAYKFRLQ